MIITKEEFEAYNNLKDKLNKRIYEIFKLLKGKELGYGYEDYGFFDDEIMFVSGHTCMGEHSINDYFRPLNYLFMTDDEIIKNEDIKEAELKKEAEKEKEKMQEKLRDEEIAKLKELKNKYPNI